MRIACLLGPFFEDSEFKRPYDAFRQKGYRVTVIGTKANDVVEGYRGKVQFAIDKGIDDVRPTQFDALFIPGGMSPDHLRADDRFVQFTRQMFEDNKPIFAICHGPQLLLTADCYKNYTLTAWKTVRGDLKKAGAHVVDEPVVVDRNVVTSRKPDDIPVFIERALGMLGNESKVA